MSRQDFTPIPSPETISKPREAAFIALMVMTQLLTQAGLAQTVVPGQFISRTMGVAGDAGEISWFTAAFSLGVGTFILIAGRLGDLYGYKNIFLISYVWLALWYMLCGISHYSGNVIFFDVTRFCQGLAYAFATPNSIALLGHFYPPGPRRNLGMALFGGIAPGGFVIGALFSSMFLETTTWPWIFYSGAFVACAMVGLGWLIIPKRIGSPDEGVFDYLGAFTGVTCLVLFNFAWNQGPVVGWDKPYVYVLLIVGILSGVLFVYAEKKAKNPLIPPSVINRDILFMLGCIATGWSSFGIWNFYTFQWGTLILGESPTRVSIQFIPCMIAGMCCSLLTGGVLIRKLPTSAVMVIAMACFLVGSCLMATRPVGQIYWAQMFVSCIIMTGGMDISFPAGVMIMSNRLPKHQQGISASVVATTVNYSISIGLGFAGTVQYYLQKNGASEMKAMRGCFYMGIGLSGLAMMIGLVFLGSQFVFPVPGEKSEPDSDSAPAEDVDGKV
ncbi:unnamed protein product [Kuraishia capsulata CBS 1993]|uniref:Major facilitator superfamily (MFS) profile domain-containing protein n=1 Tax=Kuraishia capsulata CBS 1993 TaxID=1382522 RepID=W6MJI2_9ASCO|nr:uncharacterized protein KUCA_T00002104001 [Kuraishia capsulata CBS 1993]CDK26133.1 unnamed protein product [Kuraishia capsulata CBS 1993]